MLKRYGKNIKGKVVKQADVYLPQEHAIKLQHIDRDALKVCEKLVRHGYEAYIVGGAVRDLLLGIEPKDFDIVTNADPRQAKKACGYARIIGRRFPLVHAVSQNEKIFEVATFRALSIHEDGQVFGSMYEDAFRRDFTINALYYEPQTQRLIDYHGAYDHIQKRQLVPIIPPVPSFIEDPVRMLRAVKYSVTTHSKISYSLRDIIKKHARLLVTCSKSRLVEELNKVIKHEQAFDILEACADYQLLHYWLPEFGRDFNQLSRQQQKGFWQHLHMAKSCIATHNPDETLSLFFEDFLERKGVFFDGKMGEAIQALKAGFFPLVFPNAQIYEIISGLFEKKKLHKEKLPQADLPKKKNLSGRRRPRRRRIYTEKLPIDQV
ncbi:MAG: polynucleotide adenylyltransferase PcnB [Spirochaetia bacterium]